MSTNEDIVIVLFWNFDERYLNFISLHLALQCIVGTLFLYILHVQVCLKDFTESSNFLNNFLKIVVNFTSPKLYWFLNTYNAPTLGRGECKAIIKRKLDANLLCEVVYCDKKFLSVSSEPVKMIPRRDKRIVQRWETVLWSLISASGSASKFIKTTHIGAAILTVPSPYYLSFGDSIHVIKKRARFGDMTMFWKIIKNEGLLTEFFSWTSDHEVMWIRYVLTIHTIYSTVSMELKNLMTIWLIRFFPWIQFSSPVQQIP